MKPRVFKICISNNDDHEIVAIKSCIKTVNELKSEVLVRYPELEHKALKVYYEGKSCRSFFSIILLFRSTKSTKDHIILLNSEFPPVSLFANADLFPSVFRLQGRQNHHFRRGRFRDIPRESEFGQSSCNGSERRGSGKSTLQSTPQALREASGQQ